MATQTLTKQAVGAGETPYQINPEQIERASKALSKHIAEDRQRRLAESGKRDLLNDDDDDDDDAGSAAEDGEKEAQPIEEDGALWLVLSTKKYITDKTRLKPYKVRVPHPLHQESHTSICLITADPQRRYKDLIADAAFPADLRPLITRVIGVSKLKAKFKSYESRRQLAAEHTHVFADSRVITALPFLLGKGFYRSSLKRPVPVDLVGHAVRRVNTDLARKAKKARYEAGDRASALFASPAELGRELQKALSSALVTLSPATSTAVRVGFANWPAEKVRENVVAVIDGVLSTDPASADRIIPGGWKNVRSVHIKGSKSTALPLWLASELWVDDNDVVAAPAPTPVDGKENVKATKGEKSKKRKSIDAEPTGAAPESKVAAKKMKTADEQKTEPKKAKKPSAAAAAQASLATDVQARKQKLKAQKNKALNKLVK